MVELNNAAEIDSVDMRTRVVFIVNSLGFGGAERQTLTLLTAMNADAYDAHLIVLQERPQEMREADALDRGKIWRAQSRRGNVDLRAIGRVKRFLQHIRPHVIVCVNTFPLLVGNLAKVLSGSSAAVAEVFHTTILGESRSQRQFGLYRFLMNRAEKVIYVCDAQKRYWSESGLDPEKAAVIHNGISSSYLNFESEEGARRTLRRQLGVANGDIAVGICAGLRPEKAHEDLVRAIDLLRERGKPFKALIIGDGPCRGRLEGLIRELELDDSVKLLGTRDDVRPFIDACDIMALVSHAVETFSLAALESMALRRPLVLSDIGGAAEQVQDGVNGYLFPKGDVRALAERLQAMEDAARRKEMGNEGRRILEQHFLLESMVSKYEALIDSLAGRGVAVSAS